MVSQLADDLLIAFVSILLVAITCCAILYLLHRYRLSLSPNRDSVLPTYKQSQRSLTAPGKRSRHTRQSSVVLTPKPTKGFRSFARPLFIFKEKLTITKESTVTNDATPEGQVPEIRVTLPEETGKDGQKQDPRVVVVHLDEKGEALGMEPVCEDLPPYEQFETVNVEPKEKEVAA